MITYYVPKVGLLNTVFGLEAPTGILYDQKFKMSYARGAAREEDVAREDVEVSNKLVHYAKQLST